MCVLLACVSLHHTRYSKKKKFLSRWYKSWQSKISSRFSIYIISSKLVRLESEKILTALSSNYCP